MPPNDKLPRLAGYDSPGHDCVSDDLLVDEGPAITVVDLHRVWVGSEQSEIAFKKVNRVPSVVARQWLRRCLHPLNIEVTRACGGEPPEPCERDLPTRVLRGCFRLATHDVGFA